MKVVGTLTNFAASRVNRWKLSFAGVEFTKRLAPHLRTALQLNAVAGN